MTGEEFHAEAVYYNDDQKMQKPVQANKNLLATLPVFDKRKLKTSDLDLASAAHPCTLSHTFYGSIGYAFNKWCVPVNCSIGGSYEFADRNTALERWLVWGKIGFSY